MGRASNRKRVRAKKARDRPDLLERLSESREFIRLSSASYDGGYEAEAKRLAVALRVLLHDTGTSNSLLGLLDAKATLKFVDTADPINPANLLRSHPGLVIMSLGFDGDRATGSYVAPLGDVPPDRIGVVKGFDPWWNTPVLRDSDGEVWSRRDLVLSLANQEGGAHVDPKLSDKYERMVKQNGLGWVSVSGEVEEPLGGNVVAVAVRQIAFEVEQTLQDHPHLFEP
ncbi:hypothetical protein M3697_08115 [Janibacter melonis]|uniref:hypothetical protein n=1 Tax=Janibacter melonis TaxID=262209 RepID=UPI002044CADF|nr:hypothetical protein [Janibacter melonis]MCM3555068.1 hypothetical protein [Janibacter melonis]